MLPISQKNEPSSNNLPYKSKPVLVEDQEPDVIIDIRDPYTKQICDWRTNFTGQTGLFSSNPIKKSTPDRRVHTFNHLGRSRRRLPVFKNLSNDQVKPPQFTKPILPTPQNTKPLPQKDEEDDSLITELKTQINNLFKDLENNDPKSLVDNFFEQLGLEPQPIKQPVESKTQKNLDNFREMQKDWERQNMDIFDKCKPMVDVKEHEPSTLDKKLNYAPLESYGNSLLNNTEDQESQKQIQAQKIIEKSMNHKLKEIDSKYAKQLTDNFSDTNDQLIPPSQMLLEVEKIKERLLKDTSVKPETNLLGEKKYYVTLHNYCIDTRLIDKIEKIYKDKYQQYHNFEGEMGKHSPFFYNNALNYNLLSNRMEKGRLLSILDHLLNKYRCLVDDRKVLDQVDELSDEISDTVAEYQEIMKQMNKYKHFHNQVNQLTTYLDQLSNSAKELDDLFEGTTEIQQSIKQQIEKFQEQINLTKVEQLHHEAQQCQAKFNYYQKMANEITNKIKIILPTSFNDCVYKPASFNECVYKPTIDPCPYSSV